MSPVNVPGILLLLLCVSSLADAGTIGKSQTYGPVALAPTLIGTAYNPAGGAITALTIDNDQHLVGEVAGKTGLEYGNVEELFKVLDNLGESLTAEETSQAVDVLSTAALLGQIDITDPQLEYLVNLIHQEVLQLSAIMTVVSSQGYARASVDTKVAMVFAKSVAGGTLSVDYNSYLTGGLLGITDPIPYDPELALANLVDAYNLQYGDPAITYDLSGGVELTVDPQSQRYYVEVKNDSLLLTRAMSIQELSVGFSKRIDNVAKGTLYWGLSPKFYHVGLSNVAVRIGNITDSEALFDDIRNQQFEHSNQLGVNAGVIWVKDQLKLGASVRDLNEPEFQFPAIDTEPFQNETMIAFIEHNRRYTMKRQFTLEAGLGSESGRWSVNGAIDVNAREDILGYATQWARISGGWYTGHWVFPEVRIGYHSNLKGTGLSYFAGGLSMFKYLNLDIAITADTTELEGETWPRGAELSLGFEYAF